MDPLIFSWMYTLYSLSLLYMGVAIYFRSQPFAGAMPSRMFRWLIGFGGCHGLLELVHLVRLNASLNGQPAFLFEQTTLLLASISFALLLQFSWELFYLIRRWNVSWWLHYGPLLLLAGWGLGYSASLIGWMEQMPLQWVGRYLFGVIGAWFAAYLLIRHRHRLPLLAPTHRALLGAGWGFAAYGLFSLFGPAGNLFPATWLNQGHFLAWTGMPVQFFRALSALLIALFISRSLRIFTLMEQERLVALVEERTRHLRQSEEKYRNLFHASLDAIIIADAASGILVEVNEAACRLLDRPRHELIGRHQSLLHPPAEKERYRLLFQDVVQRERYFVPGVFVQRRDGVVPVDISAVCFEGDNRLLVQGIFRDMTRYVQAEAALREQSHYLDSILRSSRDLSIAAVGADFRVKYFNPTAVRLFGMAASEVIGRPLMELHALWQVDAERVNQTIERVRREGSYFFTVQRQVAGEMRTIETRVTRIEDGGDPIGYVQIAQDVTERLRVQEELRLHRDHLDALVRERTTALEENQKQLEENQEKLRRYGCIVAASPDHLSLLDRNYIYRAVNDTYLLAHGKKREEIEGHAVNELLGEEIFEEIRPLLDLCLKGESIRYQSWFEFSQTGRCWMDVSYEPYRDTMGRVAGVVVISRNATRHKQAEEALAESEQRFALFMDHLPGIALIKDDRSRLLYVNKKFEEIYGLTQRGALGRDNHQLWPEEIANQLDGNDLLIFTTAQAHRFIEMLPSSAGMQYWLTHKFPMVIQDGKVKVLGGVAVDITEQLQAERQTQDMAKFPNENPHPVVRMNRSGRILYANKGSGALLRVWQRQIGDVVEPEWQLAIATVMDSGHPLQIEMIVEERTLSLALVPFPEQGYINLYGMDITEMKELLALLRQRQLEVEQLNARLEERVQEELEKNRRKDSLMIHQSRLAAMGEMIGNIAHQWRQPINALNLILANLRDAYELNALSREFMLDQTRLGSRIIGEMSHTIDDFRHFFKPDRKKEAFVIAAVVKNVIAMLEATFAHQRIDLRFQAPETLLIGYGFPNEFAQVILVMLGNAKDALLEHRPEERWVEIKVEEAFPFALIRVKDNGGGIPEAILERVFDPYFTTKESKQGSGIGLYMAKMIIEQHMEGDIQVVNWAEGTEFRLQIPLAERVLQGTL